MGESLSGAGINLNSNSTEGGSDEADMYHFSKHHPNFQDSNCNNDVCLFILSGENHKGVNSIPVENQKGANSTDSIGFVQ